MLKSFFSEREAPRLALGKLRERVEIGVDIGGFISCAIFRQGDRVLVEKREAVNPDFLFKLDPVTVTILAHQTPDEIGEIGLAMIKEMLAGSIHVKMPGGILSVLRNGYLDVIFSGGAPIRKMLSQIGFSSPTKLIELFRKIRG